MADPSTIAAVQCRNLDAPHQVRVEQWRATAPTLANDPSTLTVEAANAEAVLLMVAELAGILGGNEAELMNDPGDRGFALGDLTRARLLAGIEAAATMAACRLADVQSGAFLQGLRPSR